MIQTNPKERNKIALFTFKENTNNNITQLEYSTALLESGMSPKDVKHSTKEINALKGIKKKKERMLQEIASQKLLISMEKKSQSSYFSIGYYELIK